MTRFLLARLGRLLFTVLFVSTLVFFLLRLIPGDPAAVVAGLDASVEEVDAIAKRLGTDGPVILQYLRWLGRILRFDFGTSFSNGQAVSALILARLPLTFSLAALGLAISLALAIPLGTLSAVRRWSLWDYGALLVSQVGLALPEFWLGILLLLLFSITLGWFPLFGADSFRHLILPALSLGLGRAAVLLRLVRTSMIDELGKPYVVTARAKGLPDRVVKYVHALRNALLPAVTVSGLQFGYMLGGTVIVEQVFSLPGLGRLFLTAVYQRDFPVIQGGVVMVAIVFALVNFGIDLLYGVLNPKIRWADR